MELKNNVRTLTYFKKMMTGDTKNILPFPIKVQKPVPMQLACTPLPRCTPEQAGVPAQALDRFLRSLAGAEQVGAHTVMVLRHGKVLCEACFAPYDTHYWHVSHSLCKSFTGTAIAMLIEEGLLSLEEKVCDIFPDKCSLLTSKRMRAVTVKHLVTMRSGVKFREVGAVQERDWVAAFLSADVQYEPGKEFNYNSMNSYMLSAIVTRKTGETLFDYLKPRLFEPLGFGSVAWETCPMGNTKGGWGLYVMPEDLAKVGQLYLQHGVWTVDGKETQLLSRAWIDAATVPDSMHENGEEYGYQLWTHSANGSFMFNGMFGQYVVVYPALDMVVVVNAGSGNLFTTGPTWAATQQLFSDVHDSDALGLQRSHSANRALRFTLRNLRFGKAVPPFGRDNEQRWYSSLKSLFAERRSLRQALQGDADIVAKCHALEGCSYRFDGCKFGMLPIVLACMNDYYTGGLRRISFVIESGKLILLWVEGGATQRIPIGFSSAAISNVNFGGNVFTVGTSGVFTTDEDDHPVLKLTLNFLESTSTQRIKLFFLPQELRVEMNETPSLPYVMQLITDTNPEFAKKDVAFFRDIDYVNYLFNKLCMPSHIGTLDRPTTGACAR